MISIKTISFDDIKQNSFDGSNLLIKYAISLNKMLKVMVNHDQELCLDI